MEIKSQVQWQFGTNAEKYVSSVSHAQGKDLQLLTDLSEAEPEFHLLDVATGGGHVANAFALRVKKVVAYDLTSPMLAAAERFIRGNGHENVAFVQGDAEHMPFADGEFDIVTCRLAPHHFPDVRSFIAETLRVLKPGGRFLLIDNTAPEDDEYDRIYNTIEKKRDPSHHRAWKKSEWTAMTEQAGYTLELIVPLPKTFEFDPWCNTMNLPDAERAALERYMLESPQEAKQRLRMEFADKRVLRFGGEAMLLKGRKPKAEQSIKGVAR